MEALAEFLLLIVLIVDRPLRRLLTQFHHSFLGFVRGRRRAEILEVIGDVLYF